MKKIALISAMLLLASAATAQASSTGLILNDDSVLIHHISEPTTMRGIETQLSYNFMYSQEPDPRNFLVSAEVEFPQQAWRFRDNHSLTPRVDLMVVDFMNYSFIAAAGGVSYRLAATESRHYNILTEVTLAPQLTTLDKGKFLWTFKTQLNYPIAENAELNVGYRNITVKLL
ncbi:MAG: hypothetical protein U1B30_07595, partial [Pseudomonadota bacterium]|nr:hypothetical protein [Pseudomonadota bacterium]